MINYGEKPSDQMQLGLPGLTVDGEALMKDARTWAGRHYDEFLYFKKMGHSDEPVSPNFALQSMRAHFRVSVPSAYAAPFARIAMEEDRLCNFRIAKSKVDGFAKTALNR